MGEIISLGEARRRRSELGQALAEHAVMHPALRWVVGGNDYAHRRLPCGTTGCGLPGPLRLAEPGERPCRDCYTIPVPRTP